MGGAERIVEPLVVRKPLRRRLCLELLAGWRVGASGLGGGQVKTKDRTRRPPAVPGGSGGFHGT